MSAPLRQFLALTRDFFGWWFAELAGLLPRRWRELRTPREEIVLHVDAAGAVTGLETTHGFVAVVPPGELHGPAAAVIRERVRGQLRRHGLDRALDRGVLGLCFRLPADSALHCTITLPLAAETNLPEVVSTFRSEQVYLSHRIVERDAAARTLSVELTVVPRGVVDAALATGAALGLEPDRVDVAAPTSRLAAAVTAPGMPRRPLDGSGNLLAGAAPSAGAAIVLSPSAVLAAAAIVLVIVALAVPLVATHRQRAALATEFGAVKERVETAARLRQQVAALREDGGFLVAHRRNMPTVTRLIDETTRLLPDDTWLTELQIAGSEIQLAGLSGSASSLIGVLEQSGAFRDTSFRAPVMRDAETGRERFSIAAHIVAETAR
jgi:general secretion pathway protein L